MKCTHCAPSADGITADHFVDNWLHDCLYTDRDWISFAFQLISIGAWVVAQVPQFIDNYKNESADALCPWFLAEWLVGDASNLIGCLLTGTQLPLTTGTAWYYIFCDIIMMGQYTYYAAKQAHQSRREERNAKRAAIRAAAYAAQLHLHEYEELNESTTPAWQSSASGTIHPTPLHAVHSSPLPLDQPDSAWLVHTVPMPGCSSQNDSAEISRQTGGDAEESALLPSQPGCSHGGGRSTATVLGLGTGLILGCASMAASVALFSTSPLPEPQRPDTWLAGTSLQLYLHPPSYLLQDGPVQRCPVPPLPGWAQQYALHHAIHAITDSAMKIVSTVWSLCRAGLIIGYISAIAYLKSRVSQLVKNCTRGDADGLSVSMFLCAITGNVTGAVGILIRIDTSEQFLWQLPWLIGMLGTVAMDVVIASQSASAAARRRNVSLGIAGNILQGDGSAVGGRHYTFPLLEEVE